MVVVVVEHFGTLVTTFLILQMGLAQHHYSQGHVGGGGSDKDCPFGLYGVDVREPCICLGDGLWALMEDYCKEPVALHAIKGMDDNGTFCILNGNNKTSSGQIQQLSKLLKLKGPPEAVQLSASMHKLIQRFDDNMMSYIPGEASYPNGSTIITFGAPEWVLTTGDNKNTTTQSFCLLHPKPSSSSHYCLFQPVQQHDGQAILSILSLSPGGCDSTRMSAIKPTSCNPVKNGGGGGGRSCSAALGHSKVKGLLDEEGEKQSADGDGDILSIHNLLNMYKFLTEEEVEGDNLIVSKREEEGEGDSDKSGGGGGVVGEGGESDLLNENEDNVKPGLDEIGHKLMREQIDQYVDTVVSQLTGLYDPTTSPQSPKERYPVLKMLNLIRIIMQRTCTQVKPEFFQVALNSFLKVQLESFHVKEPYISHSVWVRIDYALKSCMDASKPHVFSASGSNSTCAQMDGTSKELDVHGNGSEIVALPETPPYAKGVLDSGGIREPLVETVWKMVVNAHSYCYPYFKAYFNDHHALTVALLPLFNNAIQDIWLKEGGYDVDHQRIYGGMLGDVKHVLEDVDNCVSASRHISQYPWYMSRPMRDSGNKWRRRRRDVPTDPKYYAPSPVWINEGNTLCLWDPDDPVAFLGKPVCI